MAVLSAKPAPGNWVDFSKYDESSSEKADKSFEDLQKISDSLPEGKVVGYIFSEPHADGYALYLVTKDRPLTLAHIPHGDAWELPDAHIRGLQRSDILWKQRQGKRLKDLFSRKTCTTQIS